MSTRDSTGMPRSFAFSWGKGLVVEEASHESQYHQPRIQLLEYEDGTLSVRFCYYDRSGRFQRSPLMLGADDIGGLRASLEQPLRLRSLLLELVA